MQNQNVIQFPKDRAVQIAPSPSASKSEKISLYLAFISSLSAVGVTAVSAYELCVGNKLASHACMALSLACAGLAVYAENRSQDYGIAAKLHDQQCSVDTPYDYAQCGL